MLRIFDLNFEQQKALVDYLYGFCNTVSFVVTKFYDTDDYYNDFCLHNKNTLNLIESSNLKVIKTLNGNYQYGSQKNNYQNVIYFVNLNDDFKKILYRHKFEKWRFPDLPEDLIFYQNNIMRLETITHEHLIWIHNETKADIEFLHKNKIGFRREK